MVLDRGVILLSQFTLNIGPSVFNLGHLRMLIIMVFEVLLRCLVSSSFLLPTVSQLGKFSRSLASPVSCLFILLFELNYEI